MSGPGRGVGVEARSDSLSASVGLMRGTWPHPPRDADREWGVGLRVGARGVTGVNKMEKRNPDLPTGLFFWATRRTGNRFLPKGCLILVECKTVKH